MFTSKTVFILGAGASWHYGYPTGEALVKKVIEKATLATLYFGNPTGENNLQPNYLTDTKPNVSIDKQWTTALQECALLKAGLQQVNPLVIDYFLGWNPNLQSIGRLLIAWVILECENVHQQHIGANVNRRQMILDSPFSDERIRANSIDLTKYKVSDVLTAPFIGNGDRRE